MGFEPVEDEGVAIGLHAESGEEYAPPVLAFAVADDDAQSGVVAGGNEGFAVNAVGEGKNAHLCLNRAVKAANASAGAGD
jgi:hypothetical protein